MFRLSVCVLGGFDDNSPLDCVEKYDPNNNTWTMVANMSCPRGGVGVAALGGKLYAVGGHDGTNYLSSVEEYDPETDRCIFPFITLFVDCIIRVINCSETALDERLYRVLRRILLT